VPSGKARSTAEEDGIDERAERLAAEIVGLPQVVALIEATPTDYNPSK